MRDTLAHLISRTFQFGFTALLVLTLTSCGDKSSEAPTSTASAKQADTKPVIAMLPKLINIDYFDACKRGAQKAADELGVTLIFDGPTEPSGAEQNKFIDTWVRQKVSAICIAPNQPKTIQRFVEKAHAAGIKVLTWDSDAPSRRNAGLSWAGWARCRWR